MTAGGSDCLVSLHAIHYWSLVGKCPPQPERSSSITMTAESITPDRGFPSIVLNQPSPRLYIKHITGAYNLISMVSEQPLSLPQEFLTPNLKWPLIRNTNSAFWYHGGHSAYLELFRRYKHKCYIRIPILG